jgi:exodeoxyribonuclease V beta subunit
MKSYQPLDILTLPLEGTTLVEASAGTGKTFTIAHLYLRLLLEKQMDVKSILVVTFTEAATKELIERIRTILAELYQACDHEFNSDNQLLNRILLNSLKTQSLAAVRSLLRKAIIRFDEAAIHTIHGFCRRVLSDYSFETSILFDTELVSDQQELIREIVDDFWRSHLSTQPALLIQIAQKHQLHTSGLVEFANRIMRMPTARIVPPPAEGPSERIAECLEAIIREWQRSGQEIREIISTDKGLKRDQYTYRPDLLQGYFETLERLSSRELPLQTLAVIAMFARDTINASLKKKHDPPVHAFFQLCQQLIGYEKETVIWIKQHFAVLLKQELERRKQDLNIRSFDDLLAAVHRALHSEQGGESLLQAIRKTYRAALVDEFQDTDPIQYQIFHRLFGKGHSLFLIGDPKQAIYSFRGADLFSYFEAAENVNPANGYTLDTNWRSETGMVESVNTLFSSATNPFVLGEVISFTASKPVADSKGNQSRLEVQEEDPANLVLWYLKNRDKADQKPLNKEDAARFAIEAVVMEIARLLELSGKGLATLGGRKIQPCDFAILVLRNSDAQTLKDRLTQLNIPAVLTKSGNVFHGDEARELQLLLNAVATPFRSTSLNTALATSLLGFSGEEIREFIEEDHQLEAYETHISRFSEYHELWQAHGFIRMFRKLLADYQVRTKLLSLPAGDRKLTNLLHLSELIQAEAVAGKLGINGLLSWFQDQRLSMEEREAHELRLERDDEAVQISTVFKSKGLEYPIVFCPFMWQRSADLRPGDISYHREGELVFDLGSEAREKDGISQARMETLADLVRLLYVALTRSRSRCYLVCGRIGKQSVNPLDYILTGGRKVEPSLVFRLMNEISGLDETTFYQGIYENLAHKTSAIRLESPVDLEVKPYYPEPDSLPDQLSHLHYAGNNNWVREWGIASYSKIVAGENRYHHADDDLLLVDEGPDIIVSEEEVDPDSFFDFPGGRVAGTCIHSIFENLDFSQPDPESVKPAIMQQLDRFGLSDPAAEPEQLNSHLGKVEKMLQRVLSAPLQGAGQSLTLGQVEQQNKQVELEFHFPISRLTTERLQQLIKKGLTAGDESLVHLGERFDRLAFKPIAGFMHGFIDLVFRHNGKYYIVDWKTNNLGPAYADYHPEKLAVTIATNFYDLQYLIYTVALVHYLKIRLPDFDYGTQFGGVFYLFVRGIHPELPGNGVFFDLPSHDLVSNLSQIIR